MGDWPRDSRVHAKMRRYLQVTFRTGLVLFVLLSILPSASSDSRSNQSNYVVGRQVAAGIDNEEEKVKGAYWPSYDPALIPPESIPAAFFTHVYYAFAAVNEQTFAVISDANQSASLLANFSSILRANNPSIKTLLSIGGAAADRKVISKLAADPASRRTFCESSIQLARNNSFDGLDLDWEFPEDENDMDNMATLFAEWRLAVANEALRSGLPPLLITAAVYYNVTVSGIRYPVENLTASADWLNIMCFDYHGSWENVTGEHSALYDAESDYNTDYGVSNWIQHGLPAHMAVLGIPMYGKSWTLSNESDAGVGAPALGVGPGQNVSKQPGIFYYSEIRNFVQTHNATDKIDGQRRSAYCHAGNVWVGYENPRTVSERVRYLMGKDMRGYFFWALGFDNSWTLSKMASVTVNHTPVDRNGTHAAAPAPSTSENPNPTASGRILNVWWVLLTTVFFVIELGGI